MERAHVYSLLLQANKIQQRIERQFDKLALFQQQQQDRETKHNQFQSNHSKLSSKLPSLQQYKGQLKSKLMSLCQQIDHLSSQCSQINQQNSSIQNRFIILNTTYKQLKSSIMQIKAQLKISKIKYAKLNKLASQEQKLIAQHNTEVQAINKLQFVCNNTLRLNQQMEDKVNALEQREKNLMAELEWDHQKQIQNQGNWRDSDRYTKLIEQKNYINQHIAYVDKQNNGKFMKSLTNIQETNKKIKDIQQIYQQLQINVAQQQMIIQQIMLRQRITSQQLLQATRQKDIADSRYFQNSLKIQDNSSYFKRKKEQLSNHQLMNKVRTEPSPHSMEKSKMNPSLDKIMRITRKIIPKGNRFEQQIEQDKQDSKIAVKDYAKKKPFFKSNSIKLPYSNTAIQTNILNQLPRINRNTQSLQNNIPITHKNSKNSPFKYSQQISQRIQTESQNQDKFNKKKSTSHASASFSEPQYKPSGTNSNFIRIKTRNGYQYRKSEHKRNHEVQNSDLQLQLQKQRKRKQKQRSRQHIVNYYDGLRKSKIQCLCENTSQAQQNNTVHNKQSSVQSDFMNQSGAQSQKNVSSFVLKLSKKKKRGMHYEKSLIQSRQSDVQKNQIMLVFKNQDKLNRKESKKQTVNQKLEQDSKQRLNTIDQNQQDANNNELKNSTNGT